MLRSWAMAGVLLGCGVVLAITMVTGGLPAVGAVELVVFALLACVLSPLVFPRSVGAAEAQRRSAGDRRAVIYWRPGCVYCLRLRLRLGRDASRAYWVNIWRDPAGAATVRQITGGDETVPTAVVTGRPYVNPDPHWMRARLRT